MFFNGSFDPCFCLLQCLNAAFASIDLRLAVTFASANHNCHAAFRLDVLAAHPHARLRPPATFRRCSVLGKSTRYWQLSADDSSFLVGYVSAFDAIILLAYSHANSAKVLTRDFCATLLLVPATIVGIPVLICSPANICS